MDILDGNGDFIGWFSDDPDDFYSFSDYELKIQRMVLELNEELFCTGNHLLGYDAHNALEYIQLLGKIKPEYNLDSNLQTKLREIRTWSNYRLTSCHPDELDEPRLSQDAKIADESYEMARTCWYSGRVDEALNYYAEAGLYDHPLGYKTLGDIYKDGFGGVQKDIMKAVEYYEMGAEDEISDCAFALGILFKDGADGLTPNMELAYKWIREAALLGNHIARKSLGECFEKGLGCIMNLRKAIYWYDINKTGVENGNRIRSILSQQKDALPLKLDGFYYETGQLIREPSWWEDYYKNNNMI